MGKKNKKNSFTSLTPPSTSQPPSDKADRTDRTQITDPAVWDLLKKTSERSNIGKALLVEVACQAMLGSIDNYGYKFREAWDGEREAPTKGPVEKGGSVILTPPTQKDVNAAAVYFGINASDLVRDAILGQRFNWQRLHPVNARSMSSLRMQMFELEQLGGR